jgi:tetratricopeptide (TPR) repeat protein
MKWRPTEPVISSSRGYLLLAAILFSILAFVVYPVRAQDSPTSDGLRQKAIDLFKQNRFEEALPLLEDLTVSRPNDALLQEDLGACLMGHAVNLSDPVLRRETRVRARKAFLRAKELGDNSNYLAIALSGIPEDGGDYSFSDRKEVDSAMRAAEGAFSRGDFPGAIAGYAQVLTLDPNNYAAALFTGDVYYKQKDYDNSGKWFEKAIAIDPNTETAYRYWGDALYAAGENDDAREKYVQAIVAEPYKKASWVGLSQWAQRNHVTLSQPKIQSPNSFQTKTDGNASITIDPNTLGKKDGSQFWLGYEASRVLWKNEKFKQQFPNEKEYRHSLAEESDALGAVAAMIAEGVRSKQIESKELDPQLATLLKLQQERLLEPYILISRADQGIAQDYFAYRADHRNKLIQYMHEFILPQQK